MTDRPRTPEAWDRELETIEANLPIMASQKPDAKVGIAVDDAEKRDYFVPRIQAILNRHVCLSRIKVEVIPMRGQPVSLKRETLQ